MNNTNNMNVFENEQQQAEAEVVIERAMVEQIDQQAEQQQQQQQQQQEQQEQQVEEIEEEIEVVHPSKDNTTSEKLNGLSFGTKLLMTLIVLALLVGLGYGIYSLSKGSNVGNTLLSNVRTNLRNNLVR